MAQKVLTVLDVVSIVCAVLAVFFAIGVVAFFAGAWYNENYVNVSAIPAVNVVLG